MKNITKHIQYVDFFHSNSGHERVKVVVSLKRKIILKIHLTFFPYYSVSLNLINYVLLLL